MKEYTMKFKVKQYKVNNKNRYTVLDVPIFAPAGVHTLTDGSEMTFDEQYVKDAAEKTKALEAMDEKRPIHLNHWEFDRADGKSPDADCPNFGYIEDVRLRETDSRPEIISNLSDLTWKDMNKLTRLAGRSIQILNPESKKIDSLAFLPSIPPQVKGLGMIELDLDGIEAPDSKEDQTESYMDNPVTNKINFSEKNNLVAIYFKESDMPKNEEFMEEEESTEEEDMAEGEEYEEEDMAEGEEYPEEEMGGEEEMPPAAAMPPGDDYEEEADDDEAVGDVTMDELMNSLEDMLDEKLAANNAQLLKDFELMSLKGGQSAEPATPAMAPASSVGFSEKQKSVISAYFGESKAKINNTNRFTKNEHGAEIWNQSQPVLAALSDINEKLVAAFSTKDENKVVACFKETYDLIEKSIAPKVGRPEHLTKIDKMIIKKSNLADMPEELQKYPKAKMFWEEWSEKRPVKIASGETRAPSFYQEHVSGKKTVVQAFAGYYNQYATQEGINEVIPLDVINKENK